MMDDKELQEIREAIESGDLTHDHVYQLLAEVERLRAEKDATFRRYARAMKERDVAREQANKLFLALRNLEVHMGLQRETDGFAEEIKRDDDPLNPFDIDQAMAQAQAAIERAVKAGVMAWGWTPQSAGVPAGNGDAGEGGGSC